MKIVIVVEGGLVQDVILERAPRPAGLWYVVEDHDDEAEEPVVYSVRRAAEDRVRCEASWRAALAPVHDRIADQVVGKVDR